MHLQSVTKLKALCPILDYFFGYRTPLPLVSTLMMGEYLHDRTHESLLSSEIHNIELGGGGLG